MGTETVISVAALGLALIAWSSARAQTKRSQSALVRLQQDTDERFEKWEARSLATTSNPSAGSPNGALDQEALHRLMSSVQVLEMRALEHDALLCSLVTDDEAHHLWNISQNETMTYELHPGVEAELRSLVRRGLIKKCGDFKIHELPRHFELSEHFALTESGEMLLSVRKHLQSTDTKRQDSLPPRAPHSGLQRIS